MDNKVFVPNARQKEMFTVLADRSLKFHLFYGGRRGSKTWGVLDYLIVKSLKYPKSRHLVLRKYFNDAKESVWHQSLMPILSEYYAGVYDTNITDHKVEFKNGSVIHIAGMDTSIRITKLLGREYNTIVLEEAPEMDYEVFQKAKSCLSLKAVNEKNVECHNNLILCCNPTNPNNWIYPLFILGMHPQTKGKIRDYKFYNYLKFFPEDNKENLPENYIEDCLDTLVGLDYDRLRLGEWVSNTEGLVFKLQMANVINEVPKEQIISWLMGVDWGFTHPFGLVILGIGRGGEVYVVDEYKKREMNPREIEEVINNYIIKYNLKHGVADSNEPTLIRMVNDNRMGFYMRSAKKDVHDCITKLRMLIHKNKFFIIKSCRETIKEFNSYSYKKSRDGYSEEPEQINDDLLKAIMYPVYNIKDTAYDLDKQKMEEMENLIKYKNNFTDIGMAY